VRLVQLAYWPLRPEAKSVGRHAAPLATDVERIAESIPDERWKSLALTDVAEAMAATDPDRAERVAQSITNYSYKVTALASIAAAHPSWPRHT
jgi:hypothetical protein